MQQIGFDDLARSKAIESCEAAFRGATGVSLRIVPPDVPRERIKFGQSENPFCIMVTSLPTGCASCRESQARLQRRAATKLAPVEISCFAGLSEVAVPVEAGGKHIATLVSGQFLRREPSQRDFNLIAADFQNTSGEKWKGMVREAYFNTPVVPADKLQSMIELLGILAQHLQRHAEQQAVACSTTESPLVARAKGFIQGHADEPISLTQVAAHVHLSRFYFCKLFRKETGLTLRDYIARVRLEKAKSLLSDPSLRISEIVFAAGFGSIPQFNSVFKQIVGVSPPVYRGALKGRPSGND
jgi:AraC-like DNA-binding protein